MKYYFFNVTFFKNNNKNEYLIYVFYLFSFFLQIISLIEKYIFIILNFDSKSQKNKIIRMITKDRKI